MNKVIVVSLILVLVLGLGGCITVSPPAAPPIEPPPPETEPTIEPPPVHATTGVTPPPGVPQEVLSIWKLEPPTGAYPPDVLGEVSLEPNRASERGGPVSEGDITLEVVATAGSWADSMFFCLDDSQWIDVIVSSVDTLVYFGTEEPGQAYWEIVFDISTPETVGRSSWNWNGIPKDSISAPFYGKLLYENHITHTEQGKVFTTATRLFAWEGEGDYFLHFCNYSSQKGCEITYRVYKGSTTPGWGDPYTEAKLQPWLNELYRLLVAGEISEEEYDEAEGRWLEQFK